MTSIPTWNERAMAHPDHQSGMVSEDMIRARMAEEVADLRAEVERLKLESEMLRAELISICNASRNALASAYDRARECRKALEAKP